MRARALSISLLFMFTLPTTTTAGVDAAAAFKATCAPCHGATGAGDTAMGKKLGIPSLAAPDVQKKDDATLAKAITAGNKEKKMPGFEKQLSPEQIKALVAHIRSFAKK
jgi:mono/diheme cytochrome c family protein